MPVPSSVPAASVRLFLALWPNTKVRAALLAHAAMWDWPGSARPTHPERLHVTVHFLGSVAVDRLPQLRTALNLAWEGGDLVLDRPAVWPGGIAVLEATRVGSGLVELHSRLADALRALDLPVDQRPWRPHVTLARKASGAHPPAATHPVTWRVEPAYLLVQSLPGGRGYEPVASFGP